MMMQFNKIVVLLSLLHISTTFVVGANTLSCGDSEGIQIDVCEEVKGSRTSFYFSGCCIFNDYTSIGGHDCKGSRNHYLTADRWYQDVDFPFLSGNLHHDKDVEATKDQEMLVGEVKVTNPSGDGKPKIGEIRKMHIGSPVQTAGKKGEISFVTDYDGHIGIEKGGKMELSGAGKFVIGMDYLPDLSVMKSELNQCKLTVKQHSSCENF